jgi:hypothetical protein
MSNIGSAAQLPTCKCPSLHRVTTIFKKITKLGILCRCTEFQGLLQAEHLGAENYTTLIGHSGLTNTSKAEDFELITIILNMFMQ